MAPTRYKRVRSRDRGRFRSKECNARVSMVTYRDIWRRHGGYVGALVVVTVLSSYPLLCALLLSAIVAVIVRDVGTHPHFAVLVGGIGALACAVCVNGSVHTLWFAHGVSGINVPLSLGPTLAIAGHWVLDAYWLTMLREARRDTLP